MVYLSQQEQILFFRGRKRFGLSTFLGEIFLGYTYLGDDNPHAGVYQLRNSAQQRKYVKTLMYWPKNPQTPTQQEWRAVCAAAVLEWQSMSPEDKELWKHLGRGRNLPGYNAFMSDYLHTHRLS